MAVNLIAWLIVGVATLLGLYCLFALFQGRNRLRDLSILMLVGLVFGRLFTAYAVARWAFISSP